jgi:hypothetical protein
MPKFLTIGYGDRAGYDRTPKDVRDAAHAHEAELQKHGALIGVAGAPVQVRNPLAARAQTETSASLSSALPVAGFAVIEAADLSEAIKIVSQTPCAVAHRVVEVWPLEEAQMRADSAIEERPQWQRRGTLRTLRTYRRLYALP